MVLWRAASCCVVLLACSALQASQAKAATVLAEGDAHLLHLLQPAARSALPGWMDCHERLAGEVAAAELAGAALDLLLVGDSIFESFRGTSVGYDMSDEFAVNKASWERAAPQRSMVLAVSGDQTVHVLWRLQNGEGPRGLKPAKVALMIGTNDVSHLSYLQRLNTTQVGHIVCLGVQQVVRELQRQAPQATITLFGLLPLQPNLRGPPQRIYDETITAVNDALGKYVAGEASPRLRYKKDCGAAFLKPDGWIDYSLMPDGVHPAGPGGQALVDCVLGALGVLPA